jgi:hypothetical protein
VDKSNVELVRAGLEGNIGSFGRSVNQAIVTKNRHDIGAKLYDYTEQMERLALSDPETAKKQGVMAIDSQGPLAGMAADQVAKLRQGFVERLTFNQARQQLNGVVNDAAGLDAFVKALPAMADLSPDRKNALESTALHMKASLEAKGIAAENRRVATVGRTITQLEARIAMGIPVDAADLANVQTAARGTEHEDRATALAEEQKVIADVLKRPLADQAAYATQLKQELLTTGKGNPRIVQLVDRTVKSGIELYKTNPMAYAMNRAGAVVEPLDMANVASWGENLGNRAIVWAGLKQQTGVTPGGPLFPQEAQAFADQLNKGRLETKRMLLGKLHDGLGDPAYKSAMQQIAPDDPVLAAAGLAAGRGQDSRADAILRGHDLLRPNRKEDGQPAGGKVMSMPTDTDLMKVWSTRARDAFADNSEAGSLYFQSAKAIYAKMSDQAGDLSGVLSGSRWDAAIDEATGGFQKYRGRTVVLPYGQSYSQFRDGVRERFDILVKTGALDKAWTVDKLMDLPLQNKGDTKYIVRAGDGKLVDKKGRDVVIDFDQPLPYAPSGDKPYRFMPIVGQ